MFETIVPTCCWALETSPADCSCRPLDNPLITISAITSSTKIIMMGMAVPLCEHPGQRRGLGDQLDLSNTNATDPFVAGQDVAACAGVTDAPLEATSEPPPRKDPTEGLDPM